MHTPTDKNDCKILCNLLLDRGQQIYFVTFHKIHKSYFKLHSSAFGDLDYVTNIFTKAIK